MTPLDDYLRSLPGRCPSCGVHLASQPDLHRGGCYTTAKALGERGMALASQAHPDERARVDAAIRTLAARPGEWSANDLRELTGGIRGPVVGAAFQAAAKAGLIRKVGFTPSTDPGTHGHPISTWRGVAA